MDPNLIANLHEFFMDIISASDDQAKVREIAVEGIAYLEEAALADSPVPSLSTH